MFDEILESKADVIVEKINNCRDKESLDLVEEKYVEIQHPHIGYRFGEKYIIFNQKQSSFKYLIHSASFCSEKSNFWLGTGYANSIGHSLFYLLTQYNYNSELNPILSKIFANAYIYLSVCIFNMKEKAYDSCRTRAKLISNFDIQSSNKIIQKYYSNNINLHKEILSLGDYYLASIGLLENNFIKDSDNCFRWSNENYDTLKKLPEYELTEKMNLSNFANISLENSNFFFGNLLEAYKQNEFAINEYEWEKLKNSQNRHMF